MPSPRPLYGPLAEASRVKVLVVANISYFYFFLRVLLLCFYCCSIHPMLYPSPPLLLSYVAQPIPILRLFPPSLPPPHNPKTFRLALSSPAVFRPLDTCAANVALTSGFFFNRS